MNPLELASYGPVIPVIVIDRLEDAVPMAKALVAGGVRVLEVTLRTAAGLPAIKAIAHEVPGAVVGAGTVRDADDVHAAHAAGAKFIVSPEALGGGPLAKVRDGDLIRLDAVAGTLQVLVPEAEWAARPLAERSRALGEAHGAGFGRNLFAGLRRNVSTAEEGACTWLP